MCWTIPTGVTFAMMIEIFIAQTIWGAIGSHRTIKVVITFRIKRLFVTISINFAIRINGAVPITVTRSVWSGSWASRVNLNDATLDCETRKND